VITVIKEDKWKTYVTMSSGSNKKENFGSPLLTLLITFRHLIDINILVHMPNYFSDFLNVYSALRIRHNSSHGKLNLFSLCQYEVNVFSYLLSVCLHLFHGLHELSTIRR
jgi:hypothetical protein